MQVPSGGRSLTESHINRDGLPAGTIAPVFRLPGLDALELSLDQYRGRPLLLVFSAPDCGPCGELAPELEQVRRTAIGLQILMVSRGTLEENQAKAREHGLTFPIVLQRHWEISRKYGIFATPVAYLINEQGVTVADVAAGPGPILSLVANYSDALEAFRAGITMRARLQNRLEELKTEFTAGRLRLQEAEEQLTNLKSTLLRVAGAIQVLEELLTAEEGMPRSNSRDPQLGTNQTQTTTSPDSTQENN